MHRVHGVLPAAFRSPRYPRGAWGLGSAWRRDNAIHTYPPLPLKGGTTSLRPSDRRRTHHETLCPACRPQASLRAGTARTLADLLAAAAASAANPPQPAPEESPASGFGAATQWAVWWSDNVGIAVAVPMVQSSFTGVWARTHKRRQCQLGPGRPESPHARLSSSPLRQLCCRTINTSRA